MSRRLAAASNSLFVTTHGGSMPSAIRNKSVSRIAAPAPERLGRQSPWLRGAAPEPPGYLTHDDVPVYRGRAVQPGTAMTAHGDGPVPSRCRTCLSSRAREPHRPGDADPWPEANLPMRYP